MTQDPRRLKVDPDFRWETGCTLSDEDEVVGEYALSSMKASVLARTGQLPVGTEVARLGWGPASKLVVAVLASGGIVAAFVLGMVFADRREPMPALETDAVEAPAEVGVLPDVKQVVVAPNPEPRPPAGTPLAKVHPLPKAPVAREVAAPPLPVERVSEVPEQAVPTSVSLDDGVAAIAPALVPPVAPPVAVEPPPVSALAAQLEHFEEAREASAEGRLGDARALYRSYLVTWPDGQLRGEALLAELELGVRLGDWLEVTVLSKRLTTDPDLETRSAELVCIHAEALLALERCAEALDFLDAWGEGSSRESAVRRSCRRRARGQ